VRSKRLAITAAVALLLGLCALAVAVLNNLQLAYCIVRKRGIWAVVSAAFYLYSISGGIYCLLRGAAPFGMHPQVRAMPYTVSAVQNINCLVLVCCSTCFAAAVLPALHEHGVDALSTSEGVCCISSTCLVAAVVQ
jgi:hypothetical protein